MDYNTTPNFIRTHGHLPQQNIINSSIVHETARIRSVPKFHGMDEVDMKYQLHCLEKAAYRAVLMAFIAQSDVISWGKEGLITELRKELNVTDAEHREFLVNIDSDESIRIIRDWRKDSSNVQESHSGGMNVPGLFPSLVVDALHEKLMKSHAAFPSKKNSSHGQPYSAPVPTSQKYASHREPYSAIVSTSQKYSSQGQPYSAPVRTSQKYASHGEPYSAPIPTSLNYAPHGEPCSAAVPTSQKFAAHGEPFSSGALKSQKYASHGEPYSAAIPSQLPAECRVDQRSGKLVLISRGKAGKSISNFQASYLSKGRQAVKSHLNDCHTPDGNFSERSGLIQIRETNKLLCEIERMVYGRGYSDPVLVEKAKLMLKEQERSLLDVLAKLSNVSDVDNSPDQCAVTSPMRSFRAPGEG